MTAGHEEQPPASSQGLPPELVPLRQGASRPVAPREKSPASEKKAVRKRHARKGRSPQAPENSPALHEGEQEAGRDDSPVVQAPPNPPAATFFNAAVKLPTDQGRKGKKAGDFPPTDSITFGQPPQE